MKRLTESERLVFAAAFVADLANYTEWSTEAATSNATWAGHCAVLSLRAATKLLKASDDPSHATLHQFAKAKA